MKKHEVKLTEINGHSKAEKSDYANLSAIFGLRNFFQIPDPDTKLPLGIPATKQAETDQDFEVIVEREAAKDGISDPDLLPHYREAALKTKVERLISGYNHYFDEITDDSDGLLLAIADKFVRYLGKGKPTNPKEPKSPVIALFCQLVSVSGIEPQNDRSAEKYCKEICEKYGLQYKLRVAKGFYGSDTKSNRDKVVKQILPNISEADRNKILTYLNHDSEIYC